MTSKEIRVGSVRPSVTSEHEISLELEAALVELDDDIGLAIPDVTFQVRIGVDDIFEGKSDAKFGVFKTPPIRIVNPNPELQIELTANDGVDVIAKQLRVNIAAEMAKINPDAETKRKIKAEIREVQKKMKEGKAEIGQVRAAFGTLKKYSDHPLAAEVALEIAETHADSTVETYSHFKNAPWSEAVMFKAVTRAPLAVLGNIGKIKYENWAARIVSMIAKWLPEDTIDHLPDYMDMPWAFQIMLQIAEENPRDAFAGIENYEYQPWAKAVAEKAAQADYEAALEFYDLYKYQPWAQEIRNLAESEHRAEREREAEHERVLAEARMRADEQNRNAWIGQQDFLQMEECYRLTYEEAKLTLSKLKSAFDSETGRKLHGNLEWNRVEVALLNDPGALWSISKMEEGGHQPNVYFSDKEGFDIGTTSKEAPNQCCCYDEEFGKRGSLRLRGFSIVGAIQKAEELGIDLMTLGQYGRLTNNNSIKFDIDGDTWLITRYEILQRGYATIGFSYPRGFSDHRVGGNNKYVSVHNCTAGWRGTLRVDFIEEQRRKLEDEVWSKKIKKWQEEKEAARAKEIATARERAVGEKAAEAARKAKDERLADEALPFHSLRSAFRKLFGTKK